MNNVRNNGVEKLSFLFLELCVLLSKQNDSQIEKEAGGLVLQCKCLISSFTITSLRWPQTL